jgi:hypothetical protein
MAQDQLLDTADVWDPAAARLISWFERSRPSLPLVPFELDPGVVVREPADLFYAISKRIAAGPNGFAAVFGGLHEALAALFSRFEEKDADSP